MAASVTNPTTIPLNSTPLSGPATNYANADTTLNPLHNYTQYSYHFVLMMTEDPSLAVELDTAAADSLDVFKHPDMMHGGKYAPKKLSGKGSNQSPYVVIFNSMSDAEFIIDRFELDTYFTCADEHQIASTPVVMSMDVIEYLTIDFPTALVYCAEVPLKSNFQNVTLLLKILFAGYPDSTHKAANVANTTNNPVGAKIKNQPHIVDIPAYPCKILDMQMSITNNGARYVLTLTPTANGGHASKNRDTVVGPAKFTIANNTVGAAVQGLQIKLNDMYKIQEKSPGDPDKAQYYKYNIILDEEYKNYTIELNTDKSNTYDSQGSPLVISPKSDDVVTIIHDILLTSKQYSDETIPIESGNNKGKTYKAIIQTYTDAKERLITIYISKVEQMSLDATDTKNSVQKLTTYYQGLGQYFEYDFIYSGKNMDIIKMDLSIPTAVSLLYTGITYAPKNIVNPQEVHKQGAGSFGTSTPTSVNQILTGTNSDGNVIALDMKNMIGDKTKTLPLVPYATSQRPSDAFWSNQTNFSYKTGRMNLTRHLTKTTTTCDIDIIGNPIFLANYIAKQNVLISKPTSVAALKNQMASLNHYKSSVGASLTAPCVKINLRAPKPWYDNISQKLTQTEDIANPQYENKFSSNFWYDGLFSVLCIKHLFEGGIFKQTLNMIKIPSNTQIAETDTIDNTNNAGAQNQSQYTSAQGAPSIGAADDSGVGTNPGNSSKKSQSPFKKPYNPVPESASRTRMLSTEYRQKLNDLEAKYQLPKGYLEAMSAIECGGKVYANVNPNAVSPTGAKGPFQFTKATCQQVGCQNPFDPDEAAECAAAYIAYIRNTYNLNLAQATMGYNWGPNAVVQYIHNDSRRLPPKKEAVDYLAYFQSKGLV